MIDLAEKVSGIDMKALLFEENENINITKYTQIAMLADSDPDYHTAQDLYYKLAKRDGYMRSIGVDIGK